MQRHHLRTRCWSRELDLCRLFFFFGLAVSGPFFHWWYGTLEKLCRSAPSGTALGIFWRVALDRLLATPPFLAATLFGLHFLQHFKPSQAVGNMRNLYWGALLMNWKVWTIAQVINFKFVPVKNRVVFGSLVAVWWNIYLSIINSRPKPASRLS